MSTSSETTTTTTTPPRPVPPPKDAPPAPKKPGASWASVVNSMPVMSLAEAVKLKPQDIGVRFGPIMTEEEMEKYRRTMKESVHIMK